MREPTKGVLSMKSKYYIPKYRYYELKYRCLQYNSWLEEYNCMCGLLASKIFENDRVDGGENSNRTYECAVKRVEYWNNMNEIKKALLYLPFDLQTPIFAAVTEGLGWQVIQARYSLVCTRDEYYKAYHQFFYRLDQIRN